MGDRNCHPLLFAQLGKSLFAEPKLIDRRDVLVVDNIEYRENGASIALNLYLDLAERLKALGAINSAIPVKIGNVLAIGIDCDSFQA